jgi:hypothetical protein
MKITLELDPTDPGDVRALGELAAELERKLKEAPKGHLEPRAKAKRPRAPTAVVPPPPEDLEGVTDLERAKVERSARAKGALI